MAIASERATDTLTGAEAAVEMLKAHGVEILFGLCGDTSLPFYDALARLPHGMRHILARDERSAAYMADGYARVSGKVGVCEGPSGGGVTYILPGLAEANESSVPLLCINSDISVSARGRYTLTELDQGALMRPVTKWNMVVNRAEDVPRARPHRAAAPRAVLAPRGPGSRRVCAQTRPPHGYGPCWAPWPCSSSRSSSRSTSHLDPARR